jgi:osmotically inducible protein OsmC
MTRKGSAVWKGNLREGNGTVSTESGVLDNSQYSFKTRFEDGKGTNPEELLAAAHAGCFSMALSNQLFQKGLTAKSIETTCSITMESLTITKSHLDLTVTIPGASEDEVIAAANDAKAGCPVSRLYNAEIELSINVIV